MILPSDIFHIDREKRILTIDDSTLTCYDNIGRGMDIRIMNTRSNKIGIFHYQCYGSNEYGIQFWKYSMTDDIGQKWLLIVLND